MAPLRVCSLFNHNNGLRRSVSRKLGIPFQSTHVIADFPKQRKNTSLLTITNVYFNFLKSRFSYLCVCFYVLINKRLRSFKYFIIILFYLLCKTFRKALKIVLLSIKYVITHKKAMFGRCCHICAYHAWAWLRETHKKIWCDRMHMFVHKLRLHYTQLMHTHNNNLCTVVRTCIVLLA